MAGKALFKAPAASTARSGQPRGEPPLIIPGHTGWYPGGPARSPFSVLGMALL